MKHERPIHIQISIDIEIHLDMVGILTGSQEVDVLDVSEVGL